MWSMPGRGGNEMLTREQEEDRVMYLKKETILFLQGLIVPGTDFGLSLILRELAQ